jgi:hypothetical protein
LDLAKPFETAVVGFFYVFWEAACRKLFPRQVVGKAFAAYSLARAARIGAFAFLQIFFFFTFHFFTLDVSQ